MLSYILFDRGLLLALREEMGFVFQRGITTSSPFSVNKNFTVVHIKTDDGFPAVLSLFSRKGSLTCCMAQSNVLENLASHQNWTGTILSHTICIQASISGAEICVSNHI